MELGLGADGGLGTAPSPGHRGPGSQRRQLLYPTHLGSLLGLDLGLRRVQRVRVPGPGAGGLGDRKAGLDVGTEGTWGRGGAWAPLL